MSKIVEQIIGDVVKGAMSEILTKTGLRKTRRTRRKAKAGTSLSGGILGDVLDAALGKPARKTKRTPAKKQVSKRRTAASRSKQRAR